MNTDQTKAIIEAHAKWIRGEEGGTRANLRGANLSGANLSGANLYGANLSGANLSGANLYGANLSGANLSGADLYGANLYGANLRGANLRGANLRGANLSGADLYGANLYGANLRGANLRGANLSGANLSGANLSGANLYGHKHAGGFTHIGHAGGYDFMLFRSEKAGVFMRYGCERHPLSWWREQTSDLSVKHGERREHWRIVEAVMGLAATLEDIEDDRIGGVAGCEG